MSEDEILQMAMQLAGRGQGPRQQVAPRLAQAEPQQPMGDKDMQIAQQAQQVQQAAQQFPQRMSQQLDLQTHTGMPPLPALLRMMLMQRQNPQFPMINGAPVQNPNPAMPYGPQGGVRG